MIIYVKCGRTIGGRFACRVFAFLLHDRELITERHCSTVPILHRTIRTITVEKLWIERSCLAMSKPSQGITINNDQLTESLALGATVISRIGSHISVVEKHFDRRFSSKTFPSRKNVTEPMLRCVSLAVSFETFLFLSAAGSFGGFMLRFDKILGARSRSIKLPWRFSDL